MYDNNHKKDPIEELFQKKTEDYKIPFNEADWLKLEERLDYTDKMRVRNKRYRWAAAACILLFALMGYFTYENYVKLNQISERLNNAQSQVQQEQTPLKPSDSNGSEQITEDEQNIPAIPENTVADRVTLSSESDQEKPDGKGTRPQKFLVMEGLELFVSKLLCTDCGVSSLPTKNDPASSSLIGAKQEADKASPVVVSTGDSFTPTHSGNQPVRHTHSASIGLVMAPDFSTVGSFSDFYNPGYKIGFNLEYKLSPDLSISAGVLQSEVRYLARGGEYQPPQNYWTYGIAPDETIAKCLLLDIPISLKYNFTHFSRSRFYATAGISSYIMLNEDYRFNYDRDDTGLVQNWSEHTGTRHWMSNASFSIGYELDVLPNWSLRVEPFMKIPLKNVGWGNVKLYSVGSFVSFNYNLR